MKKRKYVGPTVECLLCERQIPKKNTRRVPIKKDKKGPCCEVCIMLNGKGEAA